MGCLDDKGDVVAHLRCEAGLPIAARCVPTFSRKHDATLSHAPTSARATRQATR